MPKVYKLEKVPDSETYRNPISNCFYWLMNRIPTMIFAGLVLDKINFRNFVVVHVGSCSCL